MASQTIAEYNDGSMAKSAHVATNGNGKKHRYTVFFEPQIGGTYNVVFPAIPEIVTFGRTLEEARRMAADALKCHLEGLIEDADRAA